MLKFDSKLSFKLLGKMVAKLVMLEKLVLLIPQKLWHDLAKSWHKFSCWKQQYCLRIGIMIVIWENHGTICSRYWHCISSFWLIYGRISWNQKWELLGNLDQKSLLYKQFSYTCVSYAFSIGDGWRYSQAYRSY